MSWFLTSRFERREAMERARQSRTSGRARSPVPVRHDRVAGVFGKRKPRGVVIYSDWAFAAPFRISEFDRARCRRHRVLRRRTIRRPEKPSQGGSLRVRNSYRRNKNVWPDCLVMLDIAG